jgi:hypothetical protein
MPNDSMKSVAEGVPGSLLVYKERPEASTACTFVVDKPSADVVVQNGVPGLSCLVDHMGV